MKRHPPRLRFLAAFLLLVAGNFLFSCAQTSLERVGEVQDARSPLDLPRGRKQTIQAILPSNVRIAVIEDGQTIRLASGVVIHVGEKAGVSTSWVMTNAHVAVNVQEGKGRSLEILVGPQGEEERHPAKLVALGEAPDRDLAVLEVPGLRGKPATLAEDAIEVGEDVVAVGAPYGREISVSTGIVSQVGARKDGGWSFKTDAAIGYGASGGGVFRVSDGRLLAVVEGYRTAKVSFPVEERSYSFDVPMPGETFAAPVPKILAFLEAEGLGHLVAERETAAAAPRR